jgi:RNA polymerase sigma-70 factor (ECF subfamily)
MEAEGPEEQVRRARSGDSDAYCALVEAFEPRIRAFVAARLADRHLVPDLVQETFIYAYRHLSEYRPGTNFSAWLYAIARMTVLAALKSQARKTQAHRSYLEQVLVVGDLEEAEPDDAPAHALADCLAALPRRDRELLRLKYEHELSLREIADRAGKSLSWAKSLFFRLTNALHDCVRRKLTPEAGA